MSEDVVLLPNVEALVSDFLRDQTEVTALVGQRIYTAIPSGPTFPLIRVNQFYSLNITNRPMWLVANQVQLEAFGGSKVEAFNALNAAMGVMAARLTNYVSSFGTVTGVNFSGTRDQPDDTYTPAKPRWLTIATVFAHPNR